MDKPIHEREHNDCQQLITKSHGPRSAVGNVSGYRCVSDCRSRGREFVEIDHEMISTVILLPSAD